MPPFLPNISLGLPSFTRVIVPNRTNDTASLVLLEDRRIRRLFGGITLSITLNCPRSSQAENTVLLLSGSAVIGSLQVRPGEEFRARVPLDDDGPTTLIAYHNGNAKCPSLTSRPIDISAMARPLVSLEDSPDPCSIQIIPLEELPVSLRSVQQPDVSRSATSSSSPSLDESILHSISMYSPESSVHIPDRCIRLFKKLPITKSCSSSPLSANLPFSSPQSRCELPAW